MSIFLDDDDVARLAGTKIKSRQVAQLRVMGILFYINASGRPVVPKSAVEGNSKQINQPEQTWMPNVLKHG
ncbi:MAG: DUF4224 domain-containing protein [Nitrosomonas sp.]|uniref:DUF4224 domain-containing protein n=1 Tax=Nitrosomonas sp. TaxID=42353 RepID=UPI0025DAE250|nr:DUF4224 domain-containing protein [Nitrosomonas sp.]MBY0475459.1 DUF4224 domain-containing protein [Nitrosomonas sp.]